MTERQAPRRVKPRVDRDECICTRSFAEHAPPTRVILRTDKLEPIWKKSITDRDETLPSRARPVTEIDEPHLKKLRRDTLLEYIKLPHTESSLPKRPKDRILILEPIVRKSKTLAALPTRAKLRRLSEDPTVTKSNALRALPSRVKLLIETALPQWKKSTTDIPWTLPARHNPARLALLPKRAMLRTERVEPRFD
jgi:hypothetical protein